MPAIEHLFAKAEKCAEQGKTADLERLLAGFTSQKTTEYYYLHARLMYLKGILAEALNDCDRSLADADRVDKRPLRCRILTMKSAILRRQGEYPGSNRVLKECLGIAKGRDQAMTGDIYNTMAVNFWMMAQFGEAKRFYRKAHQISKNLDDRILFLKSSINLGILPIHQGNFFEAEIYLRNAIELCDKEKQERLKIYAMLNLGELFALSGKWEEGRRILQQCRRTGSRLGLTYEQGASLWLLGNIHRDEHDFNRARWFYEKALRLLERSSSYAERLYVYFNMGVMERMRKRYAPALAHFNTAEKVIEQTKERLVEGQINMEKGYLLWLMGEKREALRFLGKGLEKTKGRQYDHFVGRLYSFCIRKARDRGENAEFDRLLKFGAKKGYEAIFLKERDTLLPVLCDSMARSKKMRQAGGLLLDLAARDKTIVGHLLRERSRSCREAALFVVERLQLKEYLPAVKDMILDASSPAAQKAIEVMERMDAAERVAHLRIDLLGRFRVTVDGNVTVHIVREKARDLLKILVLYNERGLLMDQLMEMLWPGEPPAKSFNSLRQTVHLLRRDLTRYGLNATETIRRERGSYEFRHPVKKLEVDLFLFLDLADRGDHSFEKGDSRHALSLYEEAIGLYRGPLLTENLYDGWTEQPRKRTRAVFVRIVDSSFRIISRTDDRKAKNFLQNAAAFDPEAFDFMQK